MKYLLLLVVALFATNALAQLNESDTIKFQFRASLTGNRQTGNVELAMVRGKIDLVRWFGKNWVVKSQNNSLYQEFYARKADGDVYSRNYLYFAPQRRLYPYAIGYLSTNFRRKIEVRYFAGAGLTYQILQQPNHVFKVAANAVYESTRFNTLSYNNAAYNGSERIQAWRATAYASGWHFIFQKKLRLFYDAFWQPAFGDLENYRAQFDLGFDFPIWKGLSVNALYTYTYENIVALGVLQTDGILGFGLSYQFKSK